MAVAERERERRGKTTEFYGLVQNCRVCQELGNYIQQTLYTNPTIYFHHHVGGH